MRGLSATESMLAIQAPVWIGILLVAFGIALMAFAIRSRRPRPFRLGALLGTIILLYAGWHALATTTTLESRGFYVNSIFGEEERVGWSRVGGAELGGTAGARGAAESEMVIQLRSGGEVTLDLAGLSGEERTRVLAFVRARVKDASPR